MDSIKNPPSDCPQANIPRNEGRSAAGGGLRKSKLQKIECLDYGDSSSGICDSRDAFGQKSDGILDLVAIDDGMCAG